MPPEITRSTGGTRSARQGASAQSSGRSAHLPVDDALAPFADMLRRHLPTPEEIEQAAAQRQKLRQRRALRAGTAAALAALALLLWADPRCSARPWRRPWASARAGNWPMAARCS